MRNSKDSTSTLDRIHGGIMEKLQIRRFRITAIVVALVVAAFIAVWEMDLLPWGKEPIDGNVLNLPYVAEWNDEDRIVSPWKNVQFHTGLMFRNLFLADSSFESVEMDLAESYSVLEDGLVYEITMKDDVVWSDYEPLTVDDVVFSIEAVLVADDANGMYVSAFSNIEGAADYVNGETDHVSGLEVDGNTIRIHMSVEYPAMEQTLAQFVILPEHVLGEEDWPTLYLNTYWADPVVSGMYKIGETISYESILLVKNEAYSGEEPNIDEVMLYIDYKNADLDYYSTNNTTEIINYRSMRGMEGYEIDILFYRYFVFNMCGADGNQNEVMQDVNVRQAIMYAIDREGILRDIYFDSGEVIDSGVLDSSESYNGVEINYDPEKAKELLEASSYDTSRPLRILYYYTDSVTKYFLESVEEDLEAVGFEVEVTQSTDTSELYELREYDMMLKGLSAFSVNEWYAEYASSNPNLSAIFGGITEFESLVNTLSVQVDKDEINETLIGLQELEQELVYKIPLFTLNQMLFVREDRVSIPKNVTFGNTWYKYDVDYEEWYIKLEKAN
ncbi:MAG: ABC transporter substrate-binding protein [Eubacteriales bacterium]